jgi:hypothetical protein
MDRDMVLEDRLESVLEVPRMTPWMPDLRIHFDVSSAISNVKNMASQ